MSRGTTIYRLPKTNWYNKANRFHYDHIVLSLQTVLSYDWSSPTPKIVVARYISLLTNRSIDRIVQPWDLQQILESTSLLTLLHFIKPYCTIIHMTIMLGLSFMNPFQRKICSCFSQTTSSCRPYTQLYCMVSSTSTSSWDFLSLDFLMSWEIAPLLRLSSSSNWPYSLVLPTVLSVHFIFDSLVTSPGPLDFFHIHTI